MIKLNSWGTSAAAIRAHGLSVTCRAELESQLGHAISALETARLEEELGFMDLPNQEVDDLIAWADKRKEGIEDVVVLGIGGSSLGARAVLASQPANRDYPNVHFSENIDPDFFVRLIDQLDLSKTLVIVISKSGTTIETMSKFAILWQKLTEIHHEKASDYVIAITDPESGALRKMSDDLGFETFPVPENVGGRFSVLTHVGLVPLALQGYPIKELLKGAKATRDLGLSKKVGFKEEEGRITYKNPVVQAAADHFLLSQRGITQTVLFCYSDALFPLCDWFCQLWGESLGKEVTRRGLPINFGLTPIRALGVIDQHSQLQLYAEGPNDKHIVFIELESFANKLEVPSMPSFPEALSHLLNKDLGDIMSAELEGTQAALQKSQRPTSRLTIDKVSPENIGGFIMFWELVTAVMGELLSINAFDQPGVEMGKKIAHAILGKPGLESYLPSDTAKEGLVSVVQPR